MVTIGNMMLGMAWGSLAMAAFLGPRFTLPERPYNAVMAILVLVGSLLTLLG